MAFAKKRIDLTISLGTGQFGDSGANTVTLTGLRTSIEAQSYGGDAQPQLSLKVYGLSQSMMNQLTTIGFVNSAIRFKNAVQVAAGDDGGVMSTLYNGTISQVWADFNSIPDVCLNINSVTGLAANLKPVGALSYQGATDVATIMQTIANTMGIGFENHGVSVQLSAPYLPGTALAQMRSCARAADINAQIDRDVLIIWPKSGARGTDVTLVSPSSGMVGFPTFSSNGLNVRTLFNPSLKIGGKIQIQSSLTPACGTWRIAQLSHSLESETPNGRWFSTILAQP
jgi:hypothetical protein